MTKTTIRVLAAVLVTTGLTGCWQMPKSSQPQAAEPRPPEIPEVPESHPLQRAAPELERDSVVDRVVILSDRLQQAQDLVISLQRDKRSLEEKNRQLLAQASKLEADLAQAQGELGDANDLLREMRRELTRWKKDVLGFRDEMRAAAVVQLKYLKQVIELLGGVVAEPTTRPAAKEAAKTDETPKQPGA